VFGAMLMTTGSAILLKLQSDQKYAIKIMGLQTLKELSSILNCLTAEKKKMIF
jgi:hypothetical protein